MATSGMCQYVSEDPKLLVKLLLDADPKSFAMIYPLVARTARPSSLSCGAQVSSAPPGRGPVTPSAAPGSAGDNSPARKLMSKLLMNERRMRHGHEAVALIRLGHLDQTWHLLEFHPDPRSRTRSSMP